MPTTCSTCRHWHQVPPDSVIVNPNRPGECREQPHLIGVPVQDVVGNIGTQLQVLYLKTPPGFLACGRYVARASVEDVVG